MFARIDCSVDQLLQLYRFLDTLASGVPSKLLLDYFLSSVTGFLDLIFVVYKKVVMKGRHVG